MIRLLAVRRERTDVAGQNLCLAAALFRRYSAHLSGFPIFFRKNNSSMKSRIPLQLLIGCVLFALIWFVIVFPFESEETISAIRVPTITNKYSAPSESKGLNTSTTIKWGGNADNSSINALRNAYMAPTNRVDFLSLALSHPEGGGYFYARKVLVDCMALKATKAALDNHILVGGTYRSADAITQRTYQLALANCGTLPDKQWVERVGQGTFNKSDPLASSLQAYSDLSNANGLSLPRARTLLDRAVLLGDPYLLAIALRDTINLASGFDGQLIDKSLRSKLQQAVIVAKCELGVDCVHDASIYIGCMYNGQCPRNAMDLVLSNSNLSLNDRTEIIDLSWKLVYATKDGSISTLFRTN